MQIRGCSQSSNFPILNLSSIFNLWILAILEKLSLRITSFREKIMFVRHFFPLPFGKILRFRNLNLLFYTYTWWYKKYLTILNLLYWQSWGKIIVFILFPLDQHRFHQKGIPFVPQRVENPKEGVDKASRELVACLVSLVSIVAIASARVPSNSCSTHRNELCIPRPRFWISCRGTTVKLHNSIFPFSPFQAFNHYPGSKFKFPKTLIENSNFPSTND